MDKTESSNSGQSDQDSEFKDDFIVKMNRAGLFEDNQAPVDERKAFFIYFEVIPSVKHFWMILDLNASVKLIETKYKDLIFKKHTSELIISKDGSVHHAVYIYVFLDKIMLRLETDSGANLYFDASMEDMAQEIVSGLSECLKQKTD